MEYFLYYNTLNQILKKYKFAPLPLHIFSSRVSDKENILRNTIDSMKLGTFGQKDESQRDIRRRLTEEKRRFLTSPIINDYYKNQINIIWEEKCLEKIKQKINDYNNNNIIFSSKNDLLLRVKQELIGIEDMYFKIIKLSMN